MIFQYICIIHEHPNDALHLTSASLFQDVA